MTIYLTTALYNFLHIDNKFYPIYYKNPTENYNTFVIISFENTYTLKMFNFFKQTKKYA